MSDLKNFERWLGTLQRVSKPSQLNWNDFFKQERHRNSALDEEQIRSKFLAHLAKSLLEEEKALLGLNGWVGPLELSGIKPSDSFYYGLEVTTEQAVKLSKLGFKSLFIVNAQSIEIQDVWVDTLRLSQCIDVKLVNCFVGTLILNVSSASAFDMRGGAVFDIACPAASANGPFNGSVYFNKKVYFPRTPGLRLKGPQPYRNMRAHMLKLENTPMVGLFHTLEQATERKMEGYGFHRAISALYEYLSDYGSSALRPFMFFIGIFGITFLLILLWDGAAHANAAELAGWQESLVGNDWFARVRCAFVLAGQATLNPLGIFGIKGLLVAKTGWLALWLSVHGLLSTIFVALFVFAIRRRFKMS